MKKQLTILLAILLMLLLIACGNGNGNETTPDPIESEDLNSSSMYPMTVTDSMGREVVIQTMPERLVSSVPSNTEIIYALGKGGHLVGVSVYCNYPEEALSVDKIGDYNGPNLELIIDVHPDVFFAAWLSEEVIGQLENAGIAVLLINPSNLDETYDTIQSIGDVIGASDEANEMVLEMTAQQNDIVDKVSGYPAKKVFYEIWHDPLMSSGPGSFMNELIVLSNGINIAGDTESAYPEFSIEKLITENPDIYLTADDGFKTPEDIFNRTGYENIEAIRTGQVFLLHQDITSRPGPRIIQGLEMVAKAIHPQAFEGK